MKQAIFLLLTLAVRFANAQSIADNAFTWLKMDNCLNISESGSEQVYSKVEKEPKILQYNQAGFQTFVSQLIEQMGLSSTDNGLIKLKLLFPLNGNLCLLEVGCKNISLNADQIAVLLRGLSSIGSIEYGQQRGVNKNCQGILYLTVEGGKLRKLRNVNFGFRE